LKYSRKEVKQNWVDARIGKLQAKSNDTEYMPGLIEFEIRTEIKRDQKEMMREKAKSEEKHYKKYGFRHLQKEN